MEEAQLERSSSKWLPMVRLEQIMTPRTRREPTRVAPDRMGSPKGSKPGLFRYSPISTNLEISPLFVFFLLPFFDHDAFTYHA